MRGPPRGVLLLLLAFVACRADRETYSLECRVDDPLTCDQAKSEVCVFSNGQYKCECPVGVSRLRDGRCVLVNECAQSRLNTCHKDANCVDEEDGYTCECKEGFADISEDRVNKPGRLCQSTVNECLEPQKYGVDCDEHAHCSDTPEGYQCVCIPGFTDVSAKISKLPGRKCVEVVNECSAKTHDCSENADCIDRSEGYECKCRHGFVDASPDIAKYPGRTCQLPHGVDHYGQKPDHPPARCESADTCDLHQECLPNAAGEKICQCSAGSFLGTDGRCREFTRCEKNNECDPNAQCSNTFEGLTCKCKAGFRDTSPDPLKAPGRKCAPVLNECGDGTHDCSPQATCEDTQSGYLCRCKAGTIDVSSRYGLEPGRKCTLGGDHCSDPSLNSCDENADCVNLPDGYTCKCYTGYVDVSSNANLEPGRVCTLHTSCPSQPTDLVFLVDGSGSIGSYVFQTEVLRFISEFAELFDISPDKTRVSVVQYSDQIRHEFGLGDFNEPRSLHSAIGKIEYLTGLTRTGAAIEHVANEAFQEKRGARKKGTVSRVCIVITDGRSQDNVTIPASNARLEGIQLFAVGVTNHVLDSELETIAGSKDRFFHVNGYEDLNSRLRSLIQKVTCPTGPVEPPTDGGQCDPTKQSGCDRSKNQMCAVVDGKFVCICQSPFDLNPITQSCGGTACNPSLVSSCPDPEVCLKTPFGNYLCVCPNNEKRDPVTGVCRDGNAPNPGDRCTDSSCGPNGKCVPGPSGKACQCDAGFVVTKNGDKCVPAGTCDPSDPTSCDQRKREECRPDEKGAFTCQCPATYRRHSVTGICLIDECAAGTHDCSPNADCRDTDESYICTCRAGFLDESPDKDRRPGRLCTESVNECVKGTHNCSVNAICYDTPDSFLCRCKEGFVDESPNPAAFGGVVCKEQVDECANPTLNTCHKDAYCIDTRDAYICKCKEGFLDKDELRNPGRICEKLNTVCDSGKHDCDKNARCLERGIKEYDCVCPAGFLDRSPDPSKPGRRCVQDVCDDSAKNDCHPAAFCLEALDTAEGYTCKCRDGYIDENKLKPGRECTELVNECLNPELKLNDCDAIATCHDLEVGFTCECPVESKDISPDKSKPGRVCSRLINECRNPHLHDCSRFADCTDLEEGYECKCKAGYHDQNPSKPGRNCSYILNECESPNLNDCDTKHADCIDTDEGYDCKCREPFKDAAPKPGRLCIFNECLDPSKNQCDKNADCQDTDDGYICVCRAGFYDDSPDPSTEGRVCKEIVKAPLPQATTLSPDLKKCGLGFCHISLGEVCSEGICICPNGQSRSNEKEKCIPVFESFLPGRIIENNAEKLVASNEYTSPQSPQHIEIADAIAKGIKDLLAKTDVAPKLVSTNNQYLVSPKVVDADWDEGLLSNVSVKTSEPVNQCDLFKKYENGLKDANYRLGSLRIADDVDKLDPCRPATPPGTPCGPFFCNVTLGEVCVSDRACVCEKGFKRAKPDEKCRAADSVNLPLYVVRDNNNNLEFTPDRHNPLDPTTKDLTERFQDGVAESFQKTPMKDKFLTAEVDSIENPKEWKQSWDKGLLYNYTAYFDKGSISSPKRIFDDLYQYIHNNNADEVGTKKLFISPEQPDFGGPCYKSDCHKNARCIPNAAGGGYTCECLPNFRDLNPSSPGRQCPAIEDVNECLDKSLNNCSENANCFDLPLLYECKCNFPYVNAAGKDELPGSVCTHDYCSDISFCPPNSDCINGDEKGECVCKAGFKDIRNSPVYKEKGFANDYCQLKPDICALELHDCAVCTLDPLTKLGYTCSCPPHYEDTQLENPGKFCAAKSCALCHLHGDCIYDPVTRNQSCHCFDGWSGEFCDVAPSNAGIILLIILALLFLLLALLCCLYLCARCRCFGSRHSEGSASGQEILGSDYYTIPRAKLAKPLYGEDNAAALERYIDGGSISDDGSLEEVERRVTTDVTTREIRTTTVHNEDGTTHTTQEYIVHPNSIEQDAEQFAMTSSDHYLSGGQAAIGYRSASRSRLDDGGSDEEGAAVDRVTRVDQHHEFVPGVDGRTGVERRRNDFVTTTTSNETNYF